MSLLNRRSMMMTEGDDGLGKWKLLSNRIINIDANEIVIEKDDDGNVFSVSEIMVYIAKKASSTNAYLRTTLNEKSHIDYNFINTESWMKYGISLADGYIITSNEQYGTNVYGNATAMGEYANRIPRQTELTSIDQIRLYLTNGQKLIMAGTEIYVFGR